MDAKPKQGRQRKFKYKFVSMYIYPAPCMEFFSVLREAVPSPSWFITIT